MLAIAINYLNRQVRAFTYNSTSAEPEWPPHPDRVFMAMVAAWGQTGQSPDEEQALRWLERQEPPEIAAGPHRPRNPVTHYVPVNDNPARRDLEKLLPQGQVRRQPRRFAAAALDHPVAHLIWRDADPEHHLLALRRLCANVTNVGHSSSLTQAYIDANPPAPNWRPATAQGNIQLRTPYHGRLDDLITAYANGQRPAARSWQGYTATGEETELELPHSVFNPELIVFEAAGKGLDLHATGQLTAAFRNLIMAKCPDPPPEWISGHTPDGSPSRRPHIALMPLPFVARQHADGRVMGMAIAIPREVATAETGRCLHELLGYDENGEPRSHTILTGQWNEAALRRPDSGQTRHNLNPRTWTAPSTTWHTVTPVTIDRYYKGPEKARMERENVVEQCQRIGLPRPVAVALGQHSMLEGVPPAREFPKLPRRSDQGGNGEWQHIHATIIFAEKVRGPVIIGSGRYRGYGLCRPMLEQGATF